MRNLERLLEKLSLIYFPLGRYTLDYVGPGRGVPFTRVANTHTIIIRCDSPRLEKLLVRGDNLLWRLEYASQEVMRFGRPIESYNLWFGFGLKRVLKQQIEEEFGTDQILGLLSPNPIIREYWRDK
jgi:hypothetical protein